MLRASIFDSVLIIATPLVGFTQLPTDRLVRVLGRTALARLADRLCDRAAAGADLAHPARLRDRLRGRRRLRGRVCALRFLGARRRGRVLVARLGRSLRLRIAFGLVACRLLPPRLGGDPLRLLFGRLAGRSLAATAARPLAACRAVALPRWPDSPTRAQRSRPPIRSTASPRPMRARSRRRPMSSPAPTRAQAPRRRALSSCRPRAVTDSSGA